MASTPRCTSVSPSSRANKSGPMSEMVMRTGTPSPAKHIPQAHVATPRLPACGAQSGRALAHLLGVVAGLGHASDVALHVSHEHRHAGLGDPSASTFMVTVLPVPEAPAISPWRFAWFNSR